MKLRKRKQPNGTFNERERVSDKGNLRKDTRGIRRKEKGFILDEFVNLKLAITRCYTSFILKKLGKKRISNIFLDEATGTDFIKLF